MGTFPFVTKPLGIVTKGTIPHPINNMYREGFKLFSSYRKTENILLSIMLMHCVCIPLGLPPSTPPLWVKPLVVTKAEYDCSVFCTTNRQLSPSNKMI